MNPLVYQLHYIGARVCLYLSALQKCFLRVCAASSILELCSDSYSITKRRLRQAKLVKDLIGETIYRCGFREQPKVGVVILVYQREAQPLTT